jgi:hypothetical protein
MTAKELAKGVVSAMVLVDLPPAVGVPFTIKVTKLREKLYAATVEAQLLHFGEGTKRVKLFVMLVDCIISFIRFIVPYPSKRA